MEKKKYDQSIQGGQGGQQQGGQSGQQGGQRGDVEKRASYEKNPDPWKRQSDPAQQGGEKKQQGGRTNVGEKQDVGGGQGPQRKDQNR